MSCTDEQSKAKSSAPYECIVCGAPEWGPLPVMRGCYQCDAQAEIVPRGTRQKIFQRPEDVVVQELDGGIIQLSIDGVVISRRRK